MTDPAIITTAISWLKLAVDVAKNIRDADTTLGKAELKLRIADLIEALVDAKINISDIQDLLTEKENEIKILKEQFYIKEKVIRKGNYYIKVDDVEELYKYCLTCWDYDHKLVNLLLGDRRGGGFSIFCGICEARSNK